MTSTACSGMTRRLRSSGRCETRFCPTLIARTAPSRSSGTTCRCISHDLRAALCPRHRWGRVHRVELRPLDPRACTGRRSRQPRSPDVRGEPGEPRRLRGTVLLRARRRARFRRRLPRPQGQSNRAIRPPPDPGARLRGAHGGRVARGPVDHGTRAVRGHERAGHAHAARGVPRGARGENATISVPPGLDGRGVRLARSQRSRVHGGDAARAQQPVLGE